MSLAGARLAGRHVPEWMYYLGGRLPDEAAHPLDDFFTTDTSSAFTELDVSGTSTWAVSRGMLSVFASGQTAGDATAMIKSLGGLSAPVTIETAVRRNTADTSSSAVGFCFADGTTASDNTAGAYLYGVSTAAVAGFQSGTFTSMRSAAAELDSGLSMLGSGSHAYLRSIWKSANTFTIQISPDGVVWWNFDVGDQSKTMTPTHMAFWASTYGSSYETTASFDYIRVYESDLSA